MQITAKDEFIKIGQWFKGNINGAKFKIIDIKNGIEDTNNPTKKQNISIFIQDTNGKTAHTNEENFKRLLIDPIKGGF